MVLLLHHYIMFLRANYIVTSYQQVYKRDSVLQKPMHYFS